MPHLRPRPWSPHWHPEDWSLPTWELPSPLLHTRFPHAVCGPLQPLGDPCSQVTCRAALPTATTSSVQWVGGRPPAPLPTDKGGFLSLDTHRSASWMPFLDKLSDVNRSRGANSPARREPRRKPGKDLLALSSRLSSCVYLTAPAVWVPDSLLTALPLGVVWGRKRSIFHPGCRESSPRLYCAFLTWDLQQWSGLAFLSDGANARCCHRAPR